MNKRTPLSRTIPYFYFINNEINREKPYLYYFCNAIDKRHTFAIMYIFFLLLPVVYITCNSYLFCRVWQAMRGLPVIVKIAVALIYTAVTFAMFIPMFFRGSDIPEILAKWLFRVGSAWLFFSCLAAVLLLVTDILSRFIPAIQGNLWWALGIAAVVFAYGNYNYRHPQAVPLDITLDKPMKGELRIVVVSDLHLGYGTGKSRLKEYVKLINDCKPDVILIAGDLIDNSLRNVRSEHMQEELQQLQAAQGIFMAPGNHEYISGIEDCREFLADTNIELLCDSIVTLPCGVQIALRDDAANRWRHSLPELYENIDKSKPIILVDHQPREIAESDAEGTDLHISGHTHHGQVWPGSLITDRLFKQSHGFRKWDNAHVWVSSGISLWGPPVRLGTKGDYAIITLRGIDE